MTFVFFLECTDRTLHFTGSCPGILVSSQGLSTLNAGYG